MNETELRDKTGAPLVVGLGAKGRAFAVAYADRPEEPVGVTYFLDRESGGEPHHGQGTGTSGGEGESERIFFHTEVLPDYSRRGLAGVLVEQALVESARTGKTVVPVCPVVRGWLDKHDYEGTWRHPTDKDIAWLRAALGGQ